MGEKALLQASRPVLRREPIAVNSPSTRTRGISCHNVHLLQMHCLKHCLRAQFECFGTLSRFACTGNYSLCVFQAVQVGEACGALPFLLGSALHDSYPKSYHRIVFIIGHSCLCDALFDNDTFAHFRVMCMRCRLLCGCV